MINLHKKKVIKEWKICFISVTLIFESDLLSSVRVMYTELGLYAIIKRHTRCSKTFQFSKGYTICLESVTGKHFPPSDQCSSLTFINSVENI